jgi:hypothetical protein
VDAVAAERDVVRFGTDSHPDPSGRLPGFAEEDAKMGQTVAYSLDGTDRKS